MVKDMGKPVRYALYESNDLLENNIQFFLHKGLSEIEYLDFLAGHMRERKSDADDLQFSLKVYNSLLKKGLDEFSSKFHAWKLAYDWFYGGEEYAERIFRDLDAQPVKNKFAA